MYCRFYFSPLLVCTRPACRFLHVPISGDEKYCMEVVQQFMKILNPSYLQRAAAVFTNYYQSSRPGIYFKCQILHSLLSTLLKRGHLRDLFAVLRITAMYKTLPPPDVLLKAFKKVTALGLKEAVLSLLDVTSKCVEAGLEFTVENFDYMQHQLNRLQVSKQELELFLAMKSRTVRREAWKTGQFDLDTAVAEIEHYKEQEDWAKIGAMFNSMCLSNGSLDSLNRFCACIASVLLKDIHSTPSVPFCKFIETVSQENHINGLDKSLLGRIGISVMFGYYKTQQWAKGRKLLDALTGMKINFSTLKGLFGNECHASRCQIVNTATEIFLKSGSVEKAMNILKDTEWMISSPMWPCESIDVVNRHNLLCKIAEQTSQKNMYVETLEVLTKLPGLHDVHCSFDVTRYDDIFNRHLWSCFKYQNLRVCCSIVEFMVSKNISVDFCLLRKLIHKLGQQCLWPKARSLYKCALSLGCYPPFQGNMYCRLLSVPCSLSEIEMTLALEVFIFSNAHDIKNPSTSALQIVLKRNEDRALISETDYHAAVNRLLSAAQITSPKLVIKYATVNVSKEQVFTLDHLSALKWLDKNMYCS
ncbi:protein TOPAZ1 [Amia ocellicauda]|uniref:protein TOPAZ1 n=1 Tax=Amia ocellicauda TaxID=2972642 RepID=UPI003464BCA1